MQYFNGTTCRIDLKFRRTKSEKFKPKEFKLDSGGTRLKVGCVDEVRMWLKPLGSDICPSSRLGHIYNRSLSSIEIKKSFCIGVMGNTGTFKGAGEPAWVGSDGGQWDNRSDITFSTGDSLSFDGVDDYVRIEWS